MTKLEQVMKEAEELSRDDREIRAAHVVAYDCRRLAAEIERRVREVEEGLVEARPWSEIRNELRARLG